MGTMPDRVHRLLQPTLGVSIFGSTLTPARCRAVSSMLAGFGSSLAIRPTSLDDTRLCLVSAAQGRRPRLNSINHAHVTNRDAASMNFHRQALQPQFAERAAINRHKARVDEKRPGKPRQQAADRNGDGGATENVSDAVMRPRTER